MSLRLLNIVKVLFFVLPFIVKGQERYWVFFTDKNQSIELHREHSILSEEAQLRRHQQNIEIDKRDYPISVAYIETLKEKGYLVYRESRWLNAVSIIVNNHSDIAELRSLEFVDHIQKVKRYKSERPIVGERSDNEFIQNELYGPSFGQIAQLNGHFVHQEGYYGQGRTIAVIDASFQKVDQLPVFDSLWANNQILDTWDFVLDQDVDYNIDTIGYHGTMVLSCMGAYMEDSLIGTAPKANYLLYRTEDVSSESLVEEDNWVAAAERADIQGAHVINTSLGYSFMDDSLEAHTYEEMDGNTTIITIAADIAASKGMLIVNSAGNSGSNPWYYITAPADGDSVLTVGAIGADSILTSFSSHGPTADGRMKPNVVAQGLAAIVADLDGGLRYANGTSFSSPILAGMAASAWSALPELTSMELFRLVEESAHLYPNGNNDYGYGVPDFQNIMQYVGVNDLPDEEFRVYPNPFVNSINIELPDGVLQTNEIEVCVYNMLGEQVHKSIGSTSLNIQIPTFLDQGNYIVKLVVNNGVYYTKITK